MKIELEKVKSESYGEFETEEACTLKKEVSNTNPVQTNNNNKKNEKKKNTKKQTQKQNKINQNKTTLLLKTSAINMICSVD